MDTNRTPTDSPSFLPISSVISEIASSVRTQGAVVLCGAGISRHSGIPIVPDFVDDLLRSLNLSQDERRTVVGSGLPFEALMEELSDHGDIGPLLDVFTLGEPNANHIFLAKLASLGLIQTICTTNFDRLIETALASEGMTEGADFRVLHTDEQLDDVNWEVTTPQVIKLHGTIADRDRIVATLRQVAAKSLSKPRQKVIHHVFSEGNHRAVLVIGYSCSDAFDISPELESISSGHKLVYLVDHVHDPALVAGSTARTEPLSARQDKNPFRGFPDGERIYCDTDQIVEGLWVLLVPGSRYPRERNSPSNKDEWRDRVNGWASAVLSQPGDLWHSLLGGVFFRISDYQRAKHHFEAALMQTEPSDLRERGLVFGNLGIMHRYLREYAKALEYQQEGLKIAKKLGDKWGELSHTGNIGVLLNDMGKPRRAARFLKKALNLSQRLGDMRSMASLLGDIGAAYAGMGNRAAEITCLRRALLIAEEIGDKVGEANYHNNLGVSYSELGDNESAMDHHRRSLAIFRTLRNKQGEAGTLGNCGKCLCGLGRTREAIECLGESLRVADEVGDRVQKGASLATLGLAHEIARDFSKAEECYAQAIGVLEPVVGREHPYVAGADANLARVRAVEQEIAGFLGWFTDNVLFLTPDRIDTALESWRTEITRKYAEDSVLQIEITEALKDALRRRLKQ